MFTIEIHERINQIIRIYYLCGMWQNKTENFYRELARKLFYLILHFSLIVSLACGAPQSSDNNESLFLVATAISVTTAAIKLTYTLWKKEEILSFLHVVSTHCVANHGDFIQINKKLKVFIDFASFFLGMIFVGFIFSITIGLPIFSSDKKLPLNTVFPLDWKNSNFTYGIARVYVFTTCGLVGVSLSLTIIIWYLMMNCSIKYEILGNQLRIVCSNIGEIGSSQKKLSSEEKQNLFLHQLIDLIKSLTTIRETIEAFRVCFSNFFFVQITTSGLCICGSVYVITFSSHENLLQSAVYVFLLLYNVFDMFTVMYFGNEIKLISHRLSYCLFESDWTNLSKSCKKCIIILCEVLKQPQELVIFQLYPLNLETFSLIMQGAYNMFNILKNLK